MVVIKIYQSPRDIFLHIFFLFKFKDMLGIQKLTQKYNRILIRASEKQNVSIWKIQIHDWFAMFMEDPEVQATPLTHDQCS